MFLELGCTGEMPQNKLYDQVQHMCRVMGYEICDGYFLVENYKFHKIGEPSFVTISYDTLCTMFMGYQLAHEQINV